MLGIWSKKCLCNVSVAGIVRSSIPVCLQPVWSSVAAGGAIFPATTNIPAGSGRAVKTQLENITEHNFMQEIGCWRMWKEYEWNGICIFLINSLFSGDCDFECAIFKCVVVITFRSISNVIALRTQEAVVADLLLSVSFIIINLTLLKILTSNFLQC